MYLSTTSSPRISSPSIPSTTIPSDETRGRPEQNQNAEIVPPVNKPGPHTAGPSKKQSTLSRLGGYRFLQSGNAKNIPADFPSHVSVSRQNFKNWSCEIQIKNVLTCTPTNENQVVDVVNWAQQNGYKVRPRGAMHNWSPLTLAANTKGLSTKVLLVDTSHLKKIAVDRASRTVTAQTGITMEEWLTALEAEDLGMIATPAPGDLTLGGVLAIGGHGTRIPIKGETRCDGHTFGFLSNSILSMKAVVWDEEKQEYDLHTFDRSEKDSQAFLTHVGRAFIVEVKMQAGPNQNLRCRSYDKIPADELFAPKGTEGRTFSNFLEKTGGIEAICFPTGKVWLKTWKVEEDKPAASKEVTQPYNYPFSNSLPKFLSEATSAAVSRAGPLTPIFFSMSSKVVSRGLKHSGDIWGKSKNVLLYIKPTTLRVTASGYAVLTRREDVQRVVNDFYEKVKTHLEDYKRQGSYPISCPYEIRVSGLDKKDEVTADAARSPLLSPIRPRFDHPEWDVAVWLDILTVPGTKDSNKFNTEIEEWIFKHYSGEYAGVRVEWSKGWGYTEGNGPWNNKKVLDEAVPDSVSAGQATGDDWNEAVEILDRYDPHRLFSSPMLDSLFKKRSPEIESLAEFTQNAS